MKKRVAVLTGGGTAPGWNAGILGIAESASEHGFDVFGIEHGYEGLMRFNAAYRPIEEHCHGDLRSIFLKAGSILHSSRANPAPVRKPEVFEQCRTAIEENIRQNKIDVLIVLGGDDTIGAAHRLLTHGIVDANGSPKTIDNDLTDTLCFGHMTAAQNGKRFVEGMRQEARDFRQVAVIEAMGRNAGWLALQHSNADMILPAEFEIGKEQVQRRAEELFRKHNHAVVVVSEGFRIDGKQTFSNAELDPHGNGSLGGVRFTVEQWLKEAGLKTKVLLPGYLYRNTPPLLEDAEYSYRLGYAAMNAAALGNVGIVATGRARRGHATVIREMKQVSGGKLLTEDLYDFDRLHAAVDDETLLMQ